METKHRWPRYGSKSSRSIGSVEVLKCNNCLAHKLVFTTYDRDNVVTTTEQIVEPTNNVAYPEALAAGECIPPRVDTRSITWEYVLANYGDATLKAADRDELNIVSFKVDTDGDLIATVRPPDVGDVSDYPCVWDAATNTWEPF